MMLLSGTVKAFDRACHADAFLPKGACSPVELLERIRVMIARKRGPKKARAVGMPTTVLLAPAAMRADRHPAVRRRAGRQLQSAECSLLLRANNLGKIYRAARLKFRL